jgi:diacylglycerol kinase (ATP)
VTDAVQRRVLVIWNPQAGQKAGLPTNRNERESLESALGKQNLRAEIIESSSAEEGARLARQAADDGIEVVAAAGGDGTAHVVARELLGRDTALGLLPMGSAMNLARALGVPRELDQAAAVLASGRVRRIDVGMLGDRPFFEIVSIGLSAEAFARAQALDRLHRWGAIVDFIRLARGYRRTRIEIEVDDGRLRTRGLAVAIANGPHTGYAVTLAPDAEIDDGRLEVVVFEGLSAWGLVRHMVSVAGGRPPTERFRRLRTRRAIVRAHRPLAVRADASDAGVTPVDIRIAPGALRVVAPVTAPGRGGVTAPDDRARAMA